LTFGKSGQLPERLGVCHDSSVFVDLALELDLMIQRTLFQLPLDFFPAISVFPRHHMHSLEHATRSAAALLSVWPIEFRFGIVHVRIEN